MVARSTFSFWTASSIWLMPSLRDATRALSVSCFLPMPDLISWLATEVTSSAACKTRRPSEETIDAALMSLPIIGA